MPSFAISRCLSVLTLLWLGGCRAQPPADRSEPAEQPPPPREPGWAITMAAAGPVQFGMTPAEAAAALQVAPPPAPVDDGCSYWKPSGSPPGLSFMIEDGRVVRVDVDSAGIAAANGVHIGSTAAAVRSALGAVQETPHKYRWEDGWRYLSAYSADSASGLVFELDSSVVRKIRAGRWPAVGYVEGCM